MTAIVDKRKLYWHPLSGHSHRAQLMLSLLRLPVELIAVDLAAKEQRSTAFLSKNPFGTVPVLEDDGITIFDSNAILIYLALRYDASEKWYPRDAAISSQIQTWLTAAASHLHQGPATARAANRFRVPADKPKAIEIAESLFRTLEAHISSRSYFAATWPTIADIALYSYTSLASEGDISLEPYPNLSLWLKRIEGLDGFVAPPRHSVRT